MSDYYRHYTMLTKAVENGPEGQEQIAQVVKTLHGDQGLEAAQTVMEVIARGFGHPLRGSTLSFAGLCKANGNAAALRRMLEAGAPHWHPLRGKGQASWLEVLCTWENSRGYARTDLYSIATQPVTSCSRAFLEIAHEIEPDHILLRGPSTAEGYQKPFFAPNVGTLHYELLWKALSGESGDIQQAATFARTIKPIYPELPANAEDHLAATLDCLEFLREVRAPCSPFPHLHEPLDAAPFSLAYGLGRRKDVVKPLLKAYIDAGLLDIHRKLSRHHVDVGGGGALEIAIWARNPGAAVALVELGAQVDFAVPAAPDETMAPVLAQVTAALMRRRMAEQLDAATPSESAAPRRRRLTV